MSSDCRGDSSFFLSAVNVKELDRCTPDTVYLKHIISQWTELQSKLHAVLHKESFGSRLAGCGDYTHHWPCSYWQSLMAISLRPGRGTHYMKVTTYAPPFRPPFFRSLKNLYSFDPYILAKMGKMSYVDPYFSSKLGKMYSFDPPFLTLVAFRVDGRCWASLSGTWPSSPPGP